MSLFSKKPLLPAEVQNQVVERIKAAELKTTGEIRVYVEARCAYVDPIDRAMEIFLKLGMEKTEKRNAVIILYSRQRPPVCFVWRRGDL